MEKIAQGAEAVITRENNTITKNRISKIYRISALDTNIRLSRTKTEARLLSEARRVGVVTPQILDVSDTVIKMENISGKTIKEIFNKEDSSHRDLLIIAYNIGQNIAKLHSADIVHGDLTTSNMIVRNTIVNNKKKSVDTNASQRRAELVFIDFGLGFFSKRLEDFAQDLAVLKEALKSTHFTIWKEIWQQIKRSYKWSESDNVFKVLQAIEQRGRYVKKH